MSQAHLHLLITHLPIFGSILGTFVLAYALWSKSNHTKIAAYLLFIIAAFGAGIAYLTGEGAEEAVEDLPGVTENIIKQHEDFAMYALVALIILGIVSLMAILVIYKKNTYTRTAAIVTLFISLISFSLVARTGYLGGQIRHTEISNGAVQNNAGGENDEKDDD
ncbi:MAG: DUF2231 domain-containing protein [Ferruginibacter sp.]